MAIVDQNEGVARLLAGETVAIPTETVYGLAARIDREDSLRRIFEIKRRPFFDPLIVHVASRAQATRLVTKWSPLYEALTEAFWPGPLTLVAPKSSLVSTLITSGLDSVAIRCPAHAVALAMIKAVGVPLAAPSANLFGHTSPTTAQHVEDEFAGQVPVVDGGPCQVGVESTVIRGEENPKGGWRLELLRPGGVSRSRIEKALTGKFAIEFVRVRASPASPGHLPAHYQPANPVVIAELSDLESIDADLKSETGGEMRRAIEGILGKTVAVDDIHILRLAPRPEIAARTLYADFRRLSSRPGVILVERTANHQVQEWEAVWDRVERAATGRFRI